MEKDRDLIVDFDALLQITVKSLERGTGTDILKRTLVKIGLTKKDAGDMIKRASEALVKKGPFADD